MASKKKKLQELLQELDYLKEMSSRRIVYCCFDEQVRVEKAYKYIKDYISNCKENGRNC